MPLHASLGPQTVMVSARPVGVRKGASVITSQMEIPRVPLVVLHSAILKYQS